jgi:hypothetical protein
MLKTLAIIGLAVLAVNADKNWPDTRSEGMGMRAEGGSYYYDRELKELGEILWF